MKTTAMTIVLAMVLLAPVPESTAKNGPQAEASQQKLRGRVQRVYGRPTVYVLEGENFVSKGPLPEGVSLVGAEEIDSRRDFSRLRLPDRELWIDRMHLQFDSKPDAYCGRLVTTAGDSVTRGVRGAGGECP